LFRVFSVEQPLINADKMLDTMKKKLFYGCIYFSKIVLVN
jgi:hypothetical protein